VIPLTRAIFLSELEEATTMRYTNRRLLYFTLLTNVLIYLGLLIYLIDLTFEQHVIGLQPTEI